MCKCVNTCYIARVCCLLPYRGKHFPIPVQNKNFVEKTFDNFYGPIIM